MPDKVEYDAARHQAWVITDSGTVAGFAIAARRSSAGAEILWIAVDAARQGRGPEPGCSAASWTTWAPTGSASWRPRPWTAPPDTAPYEATRAFWERNGFVHVDTIDPLPGWEPGNPVRFGEARSRR